MNIFKVVVLSLSLVSGLAHAWSPESLGVDPCDSRRPAPELDLANSDDLFFAGRWLTRNARPYEGIQCLNRAKGLAPGYLDVRLELIHAFSLVGDKKSAVLETAEFPQAWATPYYLKTFKTRQQSVKGIKSPVAPVPGLSFQSVQVGERGHEFRKLRNEEIVHEQELREAVRLKNGARFLEARKLMDQKVLPFNPRSATVLLYSGLIHYNLSAPQLAKRELALALELAGKEVDVVLSLARALSAQGEARPSLAVLKLHRPLFKNYGCFQLSAVVLEAQAKIDSRRRSQVNRLIARSLDEDWLGERLCRELEPYLE